MDVTDLTDPERAIELIRLAYARLVPHVHRTPLVPSRTLSALAGQPLRLKCENLQKGGAFKVRGALSKASALSDAERARGLVTYSSGNHAQGVAIAAAILGTRAVVVMPEDAVPAKVAACRGYGAEVSFAGRTSDERRAAAEDLSRERGLVMVPPFDDAWVIAGQGTIGIEIVEDAPEDTAAVLVPIGGGGLISGIALALKALAPGIRVVGVEPEGSAKAHASFAAGRRVRLERVDTIADGLRPLAVGELNYAVISRHVAEVVTVSDRAIVRAMTLLLERTKLVVEPSGAAAVAAAIEHGRRLGPSVAVVSGGNLEIGAAIEKMYF
jgi:threonine dehydratase